MRSSTFAKLAAVAVAAPLFLAACGGGETGSSAATTGTTVPGTLAIGARDIAFDKKQYSAAAGDITILYLDEGNIPHTLLIEGVDDFVLRVDGNGDDDTGTVTLEPGEYLLYCDIPGHRPAMEATLTVN